jgi:hypothetical protein
MTSGNSGDTRTGWVWGVTLRSRCDDVVPSSESGGDVHSIETVVAGGDRLQKVVGDKATALK